MGQLRQKAGQPLAAGAVHGRNAGNERVHQSVQLSAEKAAQGVKAPLAVAVQGQHFTVVLVYRLAKPTGVPGVIVSVHGLQGRMRINLFQDADVRGKALVGETVGVAALFSRQKTQDVGAQYIGRYDQNRLGIGAHLDRR